MLGRKGFTMVELLIVLTIVVALAAGGVVLMQGNARRFRASEAIQILGALRRDVMQQAEVAAGPTGAADYSTILSVGDVYTGAIKGYDQNFLWGENNNYGYMDYVVVTDGSAFKLGARGGTKTDAQGGTYTTPSVSIDYTGKVVIDDDNVN